MDQEPNLQNMEQKLTPEAKVIISLFQEAQKTTDQTEKKRLLKEFVKKLVGILSPSESSNLFAKDQEVPGALLLGKKEGSGDVLLGLGGSTGGQRIFFQDSIVIYRDPQRAKRLGQNALKEERGDGDLLKSVDGKLRWMCYPYPEGNDYKFGKDFWVLFLKNFGSDIVDLLQKVE